MRYETNLFCNITFPNKTYNSKYDVEHDLNLAKNLIEIFKSNIKALAYTTEPQKMKEDNASDTFEWIDSKLSSYFKELEECYYEKFTLELLLENWDNCHNEEGLAISPPDDMEYDTAYLDGDFIESTRSEKEKEE